MDNVNINIDNVMAVAGLVNNLAQIDNKIVLSLKGNKIQASAKFNIFHQKAFGNIGIFTK